MLRATRQRTSFHPLMLLAAGFAAAVAATAAAGTAAGAGRAPAPNIIDAPYRSDQRIGPYRISSNPTLSGAVRALGPASSCTAVRGEQPAATATWGRLGVVLALTLDDTASGAQAASPCATPARARVTAARGVGTRWKTPAGLAVGSTVADVRRLYPDAVQVRAERGLHAAGWRLIRLRTICLGDGCASEIIVSPLLVAETKGDRVTALVAVVPKRL